MRCAHGMRFGARLRADGSTLFSLWAPAAESVALLLFDDGDGAGWTETAAAPRDGGWFTAEARGLAAGRRYQWRIDGGLAVPDPASRANPAGPHTPSVLVDPAAFEWVDDGWRGRPWEDVVFCEVHVGCFTDEGTFDAAAARLAALAALGVTAVQLMPLADFPGRFGWGYDGVLPFAPYHGYGTPEALKRFVEAAHRLGLMVFGDVVYNHFGPDGNYLNAYAPAFFSQHHQTAWGAGINFDGDDAATVREFFIDNALYWLAEYRFDGLRFDAVHAMLDHGPAHIMQAISQRVRTQFTDRHVHLVLENDSNDGAWLARPGTPGRYDGQWNGDVHHCLHVLLTGERDGYYAEYDRPVSQLARCLTHGFARQGGPHNAEGAAPRTAASGSVPLGATVNFLQNHDQIGNRAFGERLLALADPVACRLASAIVLLAPSTPMLFMGEADGSAAPFLYFADWPGDLGEAVRHGRQREFAQFPRHEQAVRDGALPDPCSIATFERCQLRDTAVTDDAAAAPQWFDWHRALLQTRANALRPALARLADGGHRASVDGQLLQVAWQFDGAASDRRLLTMQVNLGSAPLPAEPPPAGSEPVFQVGEANGSGLGAWSGRWYWQAGPA